MRRLTSFALVLAACGSNGNGGPDAAGDDGGDDAGFTEAPHPSPPIVMNAGGGVLAAPKVVPVFFANDAAAQTEIGTFLGMLAPSAYWTAVSSEYGVGALTIAPTVVATEAPPTTDAALRTLVASHAGGTGGWPANDANTIYAVFLPDGVALTFGGGTSCKDFGGYHNETQGIVYALMPRCASMTFPGLQSTTIATSHELLEASTDPHPQTTPAFATTDDDNAIWQLTPGAELGDMCEFARSAYQPLVGTYMVQRQWSNASAAAGHDPCVPVMATPYVEAATNLPQITITVLNQSLTTRGVTVPIGMSKTVEVDLYSDAVAPDWTIDAIDVASKLRMAAAELELTLDKTTGHNGDKLQLTIKRLKAGSQFGLSELGLASKVDGVTVGLWFALVN